MKYFSMKDQQRIEAIPDADYIPFKIGCALAGTFAMEITKEEYDKRSKAHATN